MALEGIMDTGTFNSLLGAGSTIVMLVVAIIVVAIVGLIGWFIVRQVLLYNIQVLYFYRDSYGNTKVDYDKAAVITKYKLTKLWLKRHKIGLDIDKISFGEKRGKKVAFFVKYGEKSFRPLKFNIHDAKVSIKVGEEDVNWAITQLAIESKRFDFKNWFKEYGGVAMFIFFAMLIVILLIVVLNKFEVIAQTIPVLEKISENLQRAAIGENIIE